MEINVPIRTQCAKSPKKKRSEGVRIYQLGTQNTVPYVKNTLWRFCPLGTNLGKMHRTSLFLHRRLIRHGGV